MSRDGGFRLTAPAMPARQTISFFAAAALIAGCGAATPEATSVDTAKTLDAKTAVTFQRSLSAMESGLSEEQTTELGRAINAILMRPDSRACDEAALIDHAKTFADPAVKQKLTFTRLHGLNTQQILSLGAERACKPTVTPVEKPLVAASYVKPILLYAPPYMTPELSPRYALLWVKCEDKKKRRISAKMIVGDGWEPTENGGRRLIMPSREITGQFRRFWQNNSIFFDETLAVIPPLYETITKQVPNGNGGFETRSERRLLDPQRPIRDIILPNLKTAKTMRLENKSNGAPGPTFDLTTINSDIERLEAECTPKDATHAK